jgi:hypothetical protein
VIFVVCSRSALEVKQIKNMLMALVARAAEFDGVGGFSLPRGRVGVADGRTLSKAYSSNGYSGAIPFRSTLPDRGRDPLRRIKLTDATDQGVPSFEPSQRANQLQSCEEINCGRSFVARGYTSELFDELRESFG